MIQREHAFQGIVDRFLDRVLIKPCWVTGINHENELTDNARARARGRGVKPGVPDIYVAQSGGRSVWLELKWGKNPPSDAQIAVHVSLADCGIPVAVCRSIGGVLATLRATGFHLHPNAGNLCVEYEERADAAVLKAETRKPRTSGPPRQRQTAAGRKFGATYARLLP